LRAAHFGSPPPKRLRIPKLVVYIAGFVPAAWSFYLGAVDALGPEPINALERSLGLWALRFLLASLAVTPLRQIFGVDLIRYRRALGLLAFYYASLHLWVYASFDHGYGWSEIVADVVKHPYIAFGMLAFVILAPLALTSNNIAIARMGAGAWTRLHRLVYLAVTAAPLLFLLLVKSWPLEPIAYAALAAGLLGLRLWKPRRNMRRAASSSP
jgi:methionine sulfoxide reductase heme-binding subunit